MTTNSLDFLLNLRANAEGFNKGVPCRVRLFERSSGRLINEVLTDSSGNYEFNHLTANKFFVVAHHPLNTYNAVIADLVVPK